MIITDNAGNLMNLGGLGSASPLTESNVMLLPKPALPTLQFRTGNTAFGQVNGNSSGSVMSFDTTGGIWRWRSVLNDDNNTRMLLDSTGLSVTGKFLTTTNVLEPFSTTQQTTNGVQISIGGSTAWRATFGTRYSQGEAFIAHNARQTAALTDQWQQTTPSGSTWDSLALFLGGNPSFSSLGGLHLKRAAHGTAANTFANFWTDIFSVGLNGDVTVTGTVTVGGTRLVGVPVGGIIPWLKSLTGTPSLPADYAECNGQNYTPPDSTYPYWNSGSGVTVPNLNASGGGAKRFLRGSTTSGTTGGGTTNHSHAITTTSTAASISAGGTTVLTGVTSPTGSTDAMPDYYEVVYVMRVK